MNKKQTWEEKKERVGKITSDMDNAINGYFKSPEQMKEYLSFMGKFYDYSPRNSALIQGQFRGAEAVGSFKFWKSKGFAVNKGEKGIVVLVPNKTVPKYKNLDGKWKNIKYVNEKEKKMIDNGELEKQNGRLYFGVGHVFDVSQTNAKASDLPDIFPNKWLEGNVAAYPEMMTGLHKIGDNLDVTIGEPLEELGAAKGVFYQGVGGIKNHIGLNPRNEELQNIKTLIHELAHAKLHHRNHENYHLSNAKKEFQAEMSAYTVSSYFGVDTSDYSLGYLANWTQGKELKDKTKLLNEVRETAVEFIETIEPVLVKGREKVATKEQDIVADVLLLKYEYHDVAKHRLTMSDLKEFVVDHQKEAFYNHEEGVAKVDSLLTGSLSDKEYLNTFNEVFKENYSVINPDDINRSHLLIQWSEAPELEANELLPFGDGNIKIEQLEENYKEELGYCKTKYHVVIPDREKGDISVVSMDRLDIGDGYYLNPHHQIRKENKLTEEQWEALNEDYQDYLLTEEKKEVKNWLNNKTENQKYSYEMMLRGVSPGAQPNGFVSFDDNKGRHGVVVYDRPLTDKELEDYDLKPWSEEKEKTCNVRTREPVEMEM